MLIRAKKIIGNKVVSQSGQHLGRVVDFEINSNNQSIIKYYTQEDLLGRLKEPLIIEASQVIEIKEDEIVVKDALVLESDTREVAPGYKPSGA